MATQAQVDTLAQDIAASVGAAEALRSILEDVKRLRVGAPSGTIDMRAWLAYTQVVKLLEARLADLASERAAHLDTMMRWFDEDLAHIPSH